MTSQGERLLDRVVAASPCLLITKAAQCAALLVSDVKALEAANNPLLAELGIEALKAATDLEQRLKRLKRLEAISNAE